MKFAIVACIFLMPYFLLAKDVPVFTGLYQFDSSKTQIVQTQHYVYLNVMNAESEAELKSYIQQNYACLFQGQRIYKCSQFLSENQNSAASDLILNKYDHAQIHFEQTHFSPELTNQGEVIQEWELIQKIDLLLQGESFSYDKIHYLVNDQLVKMKLKSKQNESAAYFYILNSGSADYDQQKIYLQDQIEIQEKPTSRYQIKNSKKYVFEVAWSLSRN